VEPRFHLYAFGGKHIVGGNGTGQLSLMDPTYTSEADGSVIRGCDVGRCSSTRLKRISINRFEVALEAGLGATSGAGQRSAGDGAVLRGWREDVGRVALGGIGADREIQPARGVQPARLAAVVRPGDRDDRSGAVAHVDAYINNGATVGASAA
jgi:hypothetical protein